MLPMANTTQLQRSLSKMHFKESATPPLMNDALREAGCGIRFTSAITKIVSILTSICFVDNDDQAENARTRDEQLVLVHEHFQAAVALWLE